MNLKYFFTKEDCSCPLNSLSPEEIKKSYLKELSKHGIKKVRYLNLVSKTLGFQDWTEYQKEYIDNILPFLEKNGLKQYAPNNESEILKSQHGDVSFSYRQIADRIFLSNKPIPKKYLQVIVVKLIIFITIIEVFLLTLIIKYLQTMKNYIKIKMIYNLLLNQKSILI